MSPVTSRRTVPRKTAKALKQIMATMAKESGIKNLAATFYVCVYADINGHMTSSSGGAEYVPDLKLSKVEPSHIVLATVETLSRCFGPEALITAFTMLQQPQETQTDKKVV